jgi:Fur family peroxide stress response transcriptional regulator
MAMEADSSDLRLRRALEASGQRFTEQRAAVYRWLAETDVHPTADEVFLAVREGLPGISLATVYKSLETLVGCGLAVKLTFADESARYDGRTDPHHHARCLACGRVTDIPGEIAEREIEALRRRSGGFTVTGYRLQLSGYCSHCLPEGGPAPVLA